MGISVADISISRSITVLTKLKIQRVCKRYKTLNHPNEMNYPLNFYPSKKETFVRTFETWEITPGNFEFRFQEVTRTVYKLSINLHSNSLKLLNVYVEFIPWVTIQWRATVCVPFSSTAKSLTDWMTRPTLSLRREGKHKRTLEIPFLYGKSIEKHWESRKKLPRSFLV